MNQFVRLSLTYVTLLFYFDSTKQLCTDNLVKYNKKFFSFWLSLKIFYIKCRLLLSILMVFLPLTQNYSLKRKLYLYKIFLAYFLLVNKIFVYTRIVVVLYCRLSLYFVNTFLFFSFLIFSITLLLLIVFSCLISSNSLYKLQPEFSLFSSVYKHEMVQL